MFDSGGQLLNGSFMDYAMPTAIEIPDFDVAHMETPSPFIPTGVKGMGEGYTIPAPAAVANAVEDSSAISALAFGRRRLLPTGCGRPSRL